MTLPPSLPIADRDETRPPCSLHPGRPAVTRDSDWLMCEACSLQDLPLAIDRFREQHISKGESCASYLPPKLEQSC